MQIKNRQLAFTKQETKKEDFKTNWRKII